MVDTEYEKLVQAELTRLEEQESHKRMLYDRSIGGENAPRPSREFIEKNAGPLKSKEALTLEARANIDARREQEQRELEQRQAVEQSMRERHREAQEHQARQQEQEAQKQAVMDLLNKNQERGGNRER